MREHWLFPIFRNQQYVIFSVLCLHIHPHSCLGSEKFFIITKYFFSLHTVSYLWCFFVPLRYSLIPCPEKRHHFISARFLPPPTVVSPHSDVWWKNHLSSIRCFVLWHVRLQRGCSMGWGERGRPPTSNLINMAFVCSCAHLLSLHMLSCGYI